MIFNECCSDPEMLFCWWVFRPSVGACSRYFIHSASSHRWPSIYQAFVQELGVTSVNSNKHKIKASCPRGTCIVVQVFAYIFLDLWMLQIVWVILSSFGKSNANEGLALET